MPEINKNISEEEKRLKNLFDLIPQIIYEFDLNGKFTFINKNGLLSMGYTQEDFDRGFNVIETVAPQYKLKAQKVIEKKIKNEEITEDNEYYMQRKDGSIFPALIYSSLVYKDNEPSGIAGIVVDINDRKQIENELIENQKKYSAIVDAFDGFVYICSADYKIEFMNQAFIERTGYNPIGKLCYKALHNLDEPCEWCVNNRVQNGEKVKWEILSPKDNRWYYVVNTPIYHIDGSISKQAMIIDITEKKIAEQEIIKAKEIAEKASRSKSEFLSNMSHEIRTPLNAVTGFANMLLTDEYNPEKIEMLKLIKQASNSLLDIISEILDLSKIESGNIKILKNKFNIIDLIKSVVKTFNNETNEKGLLFKYQTDEQFIQNPYFYGDEFKLRQILNNIISNSIKFTAKGEISIKINIKEKKEEEALIEFCIKDTGIGIPENMIEHIFEQFTQVEHYITKKYRGIGLGLAIVNNLVKSMNGKIDIKTEINKGSEFIIIIPFETGTQESVKQFKQTEKDFSDKEFRSTISSLKILIAEDDEMGQMLIKKLSNKHNLNIEIAENGNEVLALIKQKHFDIILMDVMMPELDGKEATRLIREGKAGEKNKDIPIIGVTAHALKEMHIEFIESGMDYVVVKPINFNEILFLIEKFCNKEISYE